MVGQKTTIFHLSFDIFHLPFFMPFASEHTELSGQMRNDK